MLLPCPSIRPSLTKRPNIPYNRKKNAAPRRYENEGGRTMDNREYLAKLFSLEGKTALITGAGGGIGSALSEGLAGAGAEVALCGRTVAKCQAVKERVEAAGGKASVHALDIADMDSVRACVAEVLETYGKVDVLLNVAGINVREGMLDVTEETYDRIMNTNLKGLYFLSQLVARDMYTRKSGSIINIGSHNDEAMLGGCSVYGATKSAVRALTRSMAVEWAQYGIRANCISPGHILTELTTDNWVNRPARKVYMEERIAMRRPGMPNELVGIALLLASDASSYMTGEVYRVDGGCMCGGTPWEYDTAY